ncbi:MAG: secretin N-terminal domain-containing protein [Phycisphaerales bacterium]
MTTPTPTRTRTATQNDRPAFAMLVNVPANLARTDWSKLAWPTAVLISICGAAVGRAQVGTFTSGSQPTSTQTNGQTNAQANQPAQQNAANNKNNSSGSTAPAPTTPVDASLNSASKSQSTTTAPTTLGNSWTAQPTQAEPETKPEAKPESTVREQTVADPFSGKPAGGTMEGGASSEVHGVKSIRANAVKVDDNGVVDLRVNGEEITAVLEMLSLQSQKNIIPYKNVNGKVFANLYGVTFYEALDALLHANGYGYVERGNFIYVYTLEDLQKLEKESRQRVWKVIKLNYLAAVDAASFAQALLSKDSVIKTNAKIGNFPGKSETPNGAEDYPGESTVMVYDFPEQVEQIEKLIKELDSRPAQVLVEATILQAKVNENNAFGVDFAVIGNLNFGDFLGVGGPLRIPDALIVNNSTKLINGSPGDQPIVGGNTGKDSALGIASSPGNTAGPATLKLGLYSNDVGVFVRLLDEVTDTTVLSNPKILALNRQAARVLIGERVGYLNTTSTNTATTQSVEFLDTGTQLYFRPFVGNDNTIRLELKPSVSSAVVRDVKNSSGSTVTVPDEITNELTTNVIVRDGQTVVLGGLFRESTQTSRKQVPLLGDIPLVGYAFRGQEDTIDRQEIIFLITPTVVTDTFLAETGDKTQDMIARVRAGTREGLLPFSRERMTAQMLMDARKLAAEGHTEQAMWKLQMALSINPQQPEAIELKEKLSGKQDVWPDRSMLNDLLDSERAKSKSSSSSVLPSALAPEATAAPKATSDHIAAAAEHDAAAEQTSSPSSAQVSESVSPAVSAPIAEVAPVAAATATPDATNSTQATIATPSPAPEAAASAKPAVAYATMRWDQMVRRGATASSGQNPSTPVAQSTAAPANKQAKVSAFGKLFGTAKPANESVSSASENPPEQK